MSTPISASQTPAATTEAAPVVAAAPEIDPSLQKAHKSMEALRSKLDKQAEQIADLKKTNAELKSAGSRIKKIPKGDKEKAAKKTPPVSSDPALTGGIPAVAPA